MPSSILPREGLTLEAIVQAFRATLLQPWLTAPLLLATLVAPTSSLALSNLLHPQLTLHALQQIIITFLALGTIYDLNNLLTRLILNNWILTTPWDWSQEIVLVTGGCSGIGELIVQRLDQRNIKTIVFDISDPKTPIASAAYYKLDITSSSAIQDAAEKIRTDIGHPTVIINNAGIGTVSTILDATENSIRGTFNVNVIAQYLMIKEFLPDMVKQDHGHIVTIASMASYLVHAGNVAYASSKAAVLAFHEGLGQELKSCYGAKRVRTTIVHPTWVRTPLTEDMLMRKKDFSDFVLEPETVAEAVVQQILKGESAQIILPGRLGMVSSLRGWPSWLQEGLRNSVAKIML